MLETRKEFEEKLPQRIEVAKKKIHVGDIINYRSHLAKVLEIDGKDIRIEGPYTEQTIDWEDIVEYNRLEIDAD